MAPLAGHLEVGLLLYHSEYIDGHYKTTRVRRATYSLVPCPVPTIVVQQTHSVCACNIGFWSRVLYLSALVTFLSEKPLRIPSQGLHLTRFEVMVPVLH